MKAATDMFAVPGEAHGRSAARGLAGLVDSDRGMTSPVGVLGMLIVFAIAATDVLTANINLSIVYCLPMAIFARTAPPRIWRVAVVLVFLAYAGYFFGPWGDDSRTWRELFFRFRTVNRTIAAGSILAIAAMSHAGVVLRRRMDSRWGTGDAGETDREVFREVIGMLEQFQAAAMALATVIVVAAVDLVIPAHFNPSIVYAVPVLACIRTRSRAFLWSVVAASLVLIHMGFHYGAGAGLDPDLLARTARNRMVTALMVLGMGAFTHLLIEIDNPRRRA